MAEFEAFAGTPPPMSKASRAATVSCSADQPRPAASAYATTSFFNGQ